MEMLAHGSSNLPTKVNIAPDILEYVYIFAYDQIGSGKTYTMMGRRNAPKNEQSSRSHFVFTLCNLGENENTKQEVNWILNLIDLELRDCRGRVQPESGWRKPKLLTKV
ncbi:hypothetical protein DVH24_024788 [Malus domestica]|uniref:Uncharacterized protein n=1 Tax=Malus domestica TaxID=3750 RepID=A0A498JML0_MALDO|nr:hypothetical protein DVH24_024788 [Malus domestica]